MTTYRLRASGQLGVLMPVLLGAFVGGVGLDAVLRAGGTLAWILLVVGVCWTLMWLRLPWALRLAENGSVTFLAPLRRTTVPAAAITAIAGRWTGGVNRWFLASVWVDIDGRLGLPLPVGFADPDAVRDHLLRLNPHIRMD